MEAIYSDDLRPFIEAISNGPPTIVRVSDVESDANGNWNADMSRVNCPTLGPFIRRDEAIETEVGYIDANFSRVIAAAIPPRDRAAN